MGVVPLSLCIHVCEAKHAGKSQPKLPPVFTVVKGEWRMPTQSF